MTKSLGAAKPLSSRTDHVSLTWRIEPSSDTHTHTVFRSTLSRLCIQREG